MIVNNTPISKSPDVADGLHDLVLVKTTVTDNPFEAGKKRREWHYQPPGWPKADETFVFFTSLERGDKINEVMTAHGIDVDASGETEVDEAKLIGGIVQGLVQKKPSKRDPSKKFPRLVNLLPKAA